MRKRSWSAFLPLVIFLLLVAAFAVALRHSASETPKFAQHLGEPAPSTELPPLDAALTGYSGKDWMGRAYLINFFASWCVPCRSEHDGLLRLARAGIPIVGIAYKDKPKKVSAFLSEAGNPYASIADDGSGRAGIDWGITGVPETYLIDAKGMIRYHAVGPLSEDMINNDLLPIWNEVKG